MAKTYKELNKEDKISFLKEHIVYEINMLCNSFQMKLSTDDINTQTYLQNIKLESFIVHARSLLQFFYNVKVRKGTYLYDAYAIDFYTEPDRWYKIRPNMSSSLVLFFDRAAKEIVHLSYSRLGLTPLDISWNMIDIAIPILNTSYEFLESMDDIFKTPLTSELANTLKWICYTTKNEN